MNNELSITVRLKGGDAASQALIDAANSAGAAREQDEARETFDVELCKNALAAVAGMGHPTPEETYGSNVQWALKDLTDAWRSARKLWRVPSKGVKVKLTRNYSPPVPDFAVGLEYTSEGLTFTGTTGEELCVVLCAGPGMHTGIFPIGWVEAST